jgi:hypothetical protein
MLADPPRSLYLILIVAAVIAGAIAARYQTRKTFLAFLAVASLLLALFLIDTFVESPREQAVRRVQAMAQAATDQKPEAFLEHVSPKFEKNGKTRNDLRTSPAWELIRQYQAKVTVSDFPRDGIEWSGDDEFDLSFLCKAEAKDGGLVMRYCKARFIHESDGSWKLKSIRFYNPGENGMRTEDPIPGFP